MLEQIKIVRDLKTVRTVELSAKQMFDLSLSVSREELLDSAELVLREICRYVLSSGHVVEPDETVAWASWLLKFVAGRPCLHAFEADLETGNFVEGADRTVEMWIQQSQICKRAGSPYEPALFTDLVVVAPGVLRGRPVDGVRFPFKAPNSGWWLFADDYAGNVAEMRRIHLHDLFSVNHGVGAFLALAPGYRFDVKDSRVWFDAIAAREQAI